MAFNQPSILVRYRGTIQGAQQTFSIGFRVPWTGDFTPAGLATLAAAVSAATRQPLAVLNGIINGTAITWTGLDIYGYPHLPGPASAQASVNFATPVFSSGDNIPTQNALVASLRTAVPGRRGRGRTYLPCTKVSFLESGGGAAQNSLSSAADDFKALVDALNSTVSGPSGGFKVSVISQVSGIANAVTQVVIDSKLDTQRRREDKIAPSYTTLRTLA